MKEQVLSLLYILLVLYWVYVFNRIRDNLIIIKKVKRTRKYNAQTLPNYFSLFIEISNLNTYSQFYDSHISDEIFKQITRLLKRQVSSSKLYTYRTDQIVIIGEFDNTHVINNVIRDEEMRMYATKVLNFLKSQKYIVHNYEYEIKVHIGAASLGMMFPESSIQELISLSEFTMLKAKEKGKELLVTTEEIRVVKRDLDSFNKDFEQGIKLDEFVPFFFPYIDTQTMKIKGVEALVRWTKDQYREIEASKFKDIANERLLFEQIDKKVIKKTFQSYWQWKEQGLIDNTFHITINLSYQSLTSINAHELHKLTEEYNIKPQNVSFDISEESILTKRGIESINKFRQFGFKISLDALNNKWFNLEALLLIDFDTLKITQPYLKNSNQSIKQRLLFQSLVEFSNKTKVDILSKGIENRNQLKNALQLNVDYVQGYYFTKPLNHEKIIVYLNKYKDGIQTH